MASPTESVVASTEALIASCASSASPPVVFHRDRLLSELSSHPSSWSRLAVPPVWAQWYHFFDPQDPQLTMQYILVLDALNFCFWPCSGYEYCDLASSLKRVLLIDRAAFDAERLAAIDADTLKQWLQPVATEVRNMFEQHAESGSAFSPSALSSLSSFPNPVRVAIPLLESRTLAVREIGNGLNKLYKGHAINMVSACSGRASVLVELVLSAFPAFRDAAVCDGRLVHFYKRAQIFVGDVWGAFGGKGIGAFEDIASLTCFADYRLPQLLRHLGILEYSTDLARRVDNEEPMDAGSREELLIRAYTVHVVSVLRTMLADRGVSLLNVELDWLLWERGEALIEKMKPHHRVNTIFY